MKSTAMGTRFRTMIGVIVATLVALPSSAQLTVDQKIHDFENIAALYAKRYAPYEWKKELFGFDLFDLGPWRNRVAQSSDDLEFFEIALEYVASLNDTHSSFAMPSSFVADLSFTVDVYDGKVLIDSIDRTRLPLLQYPLQLGDELISVDGRSVADLMTEFSRFSKRSSVVSSQRTVADFLTFRPQSRIPRAIDLPDAAIVLIEHAGGAREALSIPWVKTGVPLRWIGPVSSPRAGRSFAEDAGLPSYFEPWLELTNFRLTENDPLLIGRSVLPTGEIVSHHYALGLGQRTPVFAAGLPANFVQRLGRVTSDFHFSGTYESDGVRIGYLRIPNFAPPNTTTAIAELRNEITYFQQNTDGLVVDVMRNTGGGCYMLTAASYLIPYPFFFFGEEIRVTISYINSIQAALETAERAGAPPFILDMYREIRRQLEAAYRENRGRTGPIPACSLQLFDNPPARDTDGNLLAYTKPLITLVDDFSISAGDIFPTMLQDNQRGPLVGTRTNGAGGSVSGWPVGIYSESTTANTNSLVTRIAPVTIPGYPTTSYIENVGGQADIRLDYMTRENLLGRGAPFVAAFTHAIVDYVHGPYYEIVSRSSQKCLDVAGASTDDAAGVVQSSCNGTASQQWKLEVAGSGAFRLVDRHSGEVLDVAGGQTDDGAPVIQFPWTGNNNQLWTLEPLANGDERIVARHSGKALEVAGASLDDGAPVVQDTTHDAANQQWVLRPIAH